MKDHSEPHEGSEECVGYCASHYVDEWPDDGKVYWRCGECWHLYPSRRAMRRAYFWMLRDMYGWSEVLRRLFIKADNIWFCPFCSHDF